MTRGMCNEQTWQNLEIKIEYLFFFLTIYLLKKIATKLISSSLKNEPS